MKTKTNLFQLAAAAAVMGVTFMTASTPAAVVTTSHGDVVGGSANQAGPMFGQGITINVGADTADSEISNMVELNQVSFQTSGSTLGSGTAYLHVYDDFAVNGTTSPTTIGNLVAFSTGAVDLAAAGTHQQVTWSFNNDVISKSTLYHYILATDQIAATVGDSGNLLSANGQFELETGNPYPGGQAFRANGTTSDWDLEFEVSSTTIPIPEPSSVALIGIGAAIFAARGRKQTTA